MVRSLTVKPGDFSVYMWTVSELQWCNHLKQEDLKVIYTLIWLSFLLKWMNLVYNSTDNYMFVVIKMPVLFAEYTDLLLFYTFSVPGKPEEWVAFRYQFVRASSGFLKSFAKFSKYLKFHSKYRQIWENVFRHLVKLFITFVNQSWNLYGENTDWQKRS